MARAKKVSKATEDEHMALESAMNELSRQTDALLSISKPKKVEKPTLPSKKIVPHKNGASLDIVGHGPSSIKRNIVSGAEKITNQNEELLTAKAGYSYNEKPKNVAQDDGDVRPTVAETPTQSTPKVIKPHEGKRIDPIPQAKEEVEAKHEVKQKAESKTVEHINVSSQDDSEDIDVHTAEDIKDSAKEGLGKNLGSMKNPTFHPEEKSDGEQTDDDDNGIVRLKEDESEKPTVFDTAEYQAELHDWSKLSNNSHWSVFILLVLVSVAGVLMYLYFTNKLPQLF